MSDEAMETEENADDATFIERVTQCASQSTHNCEVLLPTYDYADIAIATDPSALTAAIAPVFGQLLWRDLCLSDKLQLHYTSDEIGGDLLSVDRTYTFKAPVALGDFPLCSIERYICPNAYCTSWISRKYVFDPQAFCDEVFPVYYANQEEDLDEWCERLDVLEVARPLLFSGLSLTYAMLEGVFRKDLIISDPPLFFKKVKRWFGDHRNAWTVLLKIHNRAVSDVWPKANFSKLSIDHKHWLTQQLLLAAGNDAHRACGELAGYLLCLTARHPSTPTMIQRDLRRRGFDLRRKQKRRPFETVSAFENASDSFLKTLEHAERCWRRLCRREEAEDEEFGFFLAAHYAFLVRRSQATLTAQGIEFLNTEVSRLSS